MCLHSQTNATSQDCPNSTLKRAFCQFMLVTGLVSDTALLISLLVLRRLIPQLTYGEIAAVMGIVVLTHCIIARFILRTYD